MQSLYEKYMAEYRKRTVKELCITAGDLAVAMHNYEDTGHEYSEQYDLLCIKNKALMAVAAERDETGKTN